MIIGNIRAFGKMKLAKKYSLSIETLNKNPAKAKCS